MGKEDSYTEKQIAGMEKTRRESDAGLILGGADYTKGVKVTGEQEEQIKKEHEGEWAPDVATWVRMHKQIACPADQIPSDEVGKVRAVKGGVWKDEAMGAEKNTFYYVDKDGAIASFQVKPEAIKTITDQYADTKKMSEDEVAIAVFRELDSKGFKGLNPLSDIAQRCVYFIGDYQRRQLEVKEKSANNSFDF